MASIAFSDKTLFLQKQLDISFALHLKEVPQRSHRFKFFNGSIIATFFRESFLLYRLAKKTNIRFVRLVFLQLSYHTLMP